MIIEANAIHINYELSGKEQAPVVVLSHSLACSLVMWWPQLELLEAHFRVLRYDTRGHGDSQVPPGPYALSQLAEDAIGLLDALKFDRVHWIGLSMGGMIGQGLALNHPDRLETLVLADTAARMSAETQPVWQERINAARREGMPSQVQSTLERWFTGAYLQQNPPAVETIRKQILATSPTGYIGCSEAIRGLNYLDRLAEITIPTLIMVGEEDPGTPVAASQAMHSQIQHSQMVVIPQAAHLSNIEQADVFNDHLMTFLKDSG